ncbi:MAG: sensor histidine kinase [Bacteroidota bacterium]
MKLSKHIEWLLHVIFWFLLLSIAMSFSSRLFSLERAFLLSVGSIVILSGMTYGYLSLVIPHFFRKGNFVWFVIILIGLLIFSTILHVILVNLLLPEGLTEFDLRPQRFPMDKRIGFRPVFVPAFFISLTIFFIVTVYQLAKTFIEKERTTAQLETENISHELRFLRSQINPHFLFNALNNLHATVQLKPEQAAEYVLKLGEMLHYVLEDCTKDKVSLQDEIRYLHTYIFFQRQRDENFQHIRFDIQGEDPSSFYLEPMLLIALVENAFQHSYTDDPTEQWIDLSIHLKERVLTFLVKNNLGDSSQSVQSLEYRSGLGLANVKRRLKLLYPNRFVFTHGQKDDLYQATLILQASEP